MTAKQIELNGKYHVKVSGNVVPVQVVRTFGYTTGRGSRMQCRDGWVCRNLKTGREIKVKSPQKFRSVVV